VVKLVWWAALPGKLRVPNNYCLVLTDGARADADSYTRTQTMLSMSRLNNLGTRPQERHRFPTYCLTMQWASNHTFTLCSWLQ